MNLVVSIFLFVKVVFCGDLADKYQTGTHQPCTNPCDFKKGITKFGSVKQLQFNLVYHWGFKETPKFALYLMEYNNLNGPAFYLDNPTTNLTGISYVFTVRLNQITLPINFTSGWVATTLNYGLQLMESADTWNAGAQTLTYPKPISKPFVINLITKCEGMGSGVEIRNYTTTTITLSNIYTHFEKRLLILLDLKGETSNPNATKLVIMSHIIKQNVTSTSDRKKYQVTVNNDFNSTNLTYGLNCYRVITKESAPPFIFSLKYTNDTLMYDISNWIALSYLEISYFSLLQKPVCEASCLTCNEDGCASCNDDLNRELSGLDCLCRSQYFESASMCLQCQPPCLSCELNETNCLSCQGNLTYVNNTCSCLDGFYKKDYYCLACDWPCQFCFAAGEESCISCIEVNKTLCQNCIEYSLDQNTCLCMDGYYRDIDYCRPCGQLCTTCNIDICTLCSINSKPQNRDCFCVSGYFLDLDKCSPCQFPCKECQQNNDTCTECFDIMILQNQTCKCPQKYYLKNQKCQKIPIPITPVKSPPPIKKNKTKTVKSVQANNSYDFRDQYEKYVYPTHVFICLTGILTNLQVIGILQFLNFTVAENVYVVERAITEVSLNKPVPYWQENPINKVSNLRWVLNLYGDHNISNSIPMNYRRIQFSQFFIPNMGYNYPIFLLLLCLKEISKLNHRVYLQDNNYEKALRFKNLLNWLLSIYIEGVYPIIMLSFWLLIMHWNKINQGYQIFDLVNQLCFLILHTYSVCSSFVEINKKVSDPVENNLLKSADSKFNQEYGFYISGLKHQKFSVTLTFVNLLKKHLFIAIMAVYFYEVRNVLIIIGVLQTCVLIYCIAINPYENKFFQFMTLIFTILTIAIVGIKLKDFIFYEQGFYDPSFNQKQYFDQGWIVIIVELVFIVFSLVKTMMQVMYQVTKKNNQTNHYMIDQKQTVDILSNKYK